MWRWMKKNRWLALGLVAVMLFTLLPTNLNWADIAIGEPERASSETRPTEDEKSEEATTAEVTTTEAVTSSETTETVTETSESTTEAATVQGTTAADMGETTETITEASTTENAVDGETAGSTTKATTSSSSKTSAAVKKTSEKSGKNAISNKKIENQREGNNQVEMQVTESQVKVNHKELEEGQEIENGSSVDVYIEFTTSNDNIDKSEDTEYYFDLKSSHGVKFNDVEDMPMTDQNGNVVGKYSIRDGKLIIQITDPDMLAQSDMKGNVTLHGIIDFTDEEIADGEDDYVSFANKTWSVTVKEKEPDTGGINVQKSKSGDSKLIESGKIQQEFRVTITSDKINKNIHLSDVVSDEHMKYLGNMQIEPSEAKDKVKISSNGKGGFDCDITEMSDKETITLVYTMEIDATDSLQNSYRNIVEYNYTDNTNKEKTGESNEEGVWVNKPTVNKYGNYDAANHSVNWTITFSGNSIGVDGAVFHDVLGENLTTEAGSKAKVVMDVYDPANNAWTQVPVEVELDALLNGTWSVPKQENGKIVRNVTITYSTKVDENYTAGLEDKKVINTVDVTLGKEKYEKPGEAVIGKNNLLKKKFSKSLENDTLLEWESTITVPVGGLENLVYTDNVSDGHELVEGITIEGISASATPVISDDKKSFTINFGKVENSTGKEFVITIKYTTKCTNVSDRGLHYLYRNDAQIEIENGVIQTDNASYTYDKKNILGKGSKGQSASGVVTWQLSIDLDQLDKTNFKDLIITDTLPDHVSYKEDSLSYSYLNEYNNYSPIGWTINSSGNTLSITIPASVLSTAWEEINKENYWDKHLYITYTTVTDLDYLNSLPWGGTQITNKAEVQEKGSDDVIGSNTADQYITAPGSLVTKTGEYAAPNANYTIEINKEGLDLVPNSNELEVTDVMGIALLLYPATLEIYNADGTVLDKSDYKVSYEPGGEIDGKKKNILKITVPDEKHLIIKYSVKVDLPVGSRLDTEDATNMVNLGGMSSNRSSATNKLNGSVVESEGQVTATTGKITLWKYDSTNFSNTLANARFRVWMVRENPQTHKYEEVKKGEVSGYNGEVYIESSASGSTTISGLLFDNIYAIQEVSAPGGYSIDPKIYWFILPGIENGTLPSAEILKQEGVVPLEIPGNNVVYFPNELATGGSFSIGKKTAASNYLEGAQLSLFKQTGSIYAEQPSLTFTTGKTTVPIKVVPEGTTPNAANMEINPGTYQLRETRVPAGYKKAADITFTVGMDSTGTITITGVSGGTFDSANNELVMTDESIGIQIAKEDFYDNLLSGAVLSLKDSSGKTIQEITTKGAPVSVSGLNIGEVYTLEEKVSPEGYETAPSIQFKIKDDGSIEVVKGEAQYYQLDISDTKLTMKDKTTQTPISISKKALGNATTELSGATLAIYDETGTEKFRWASGTTPQEIIICLDADKHLGDGKKYLTPGTYRLKEESAPAGYLYGKDIVFSVDVNGTITVNGEVQDDKTITMWDAPYKISLTKKDISNDKPLTGVKFTLSEGTTEKFSYTFENENSKWEINGRDLKIGTKYTLKETGVSNTGSIKYSAMPSIDFTINEDGTLTVDGDRLDDDVFVKVNSENNETEFEMTLYNKPIVPGNFLIGKRESGNNTEIKGVTFGLYSDEACTQEVDKWETGSIPRTIWVFNDSSKMESYSLPENSTKIIEGTYYLKEISAPFGYQISNPAPVWKLEIKANKTASDQVSVTVNVTGTSDTYSTVTRKDTNSSDDLYILNTMRELSISKKATGGGDELEGAKLTLSDENGKVIDTWVSSDKQKKIRLEKLGDGVADHEFTLKEEAAPKGYAYADDITFKIDKDGKITIKQADGTYSSVFDSKITMEDKPLTVEVQKLGADSMLLAGATLRILDGDTKQPVEGLTDWKSKETGTWSIGDNLYADKTYILRETLAPDGYLTVQDVPFKIEKDGKITWENVPNDTLSLTGSTTLKLKDKPIELIICKVENENGISKPLPGAKLELYDITDSNTRVWTSQASSSGSDTGTYKLASEDLKKLKVGHKYRLYEAVPPNGYARAQSIVFTLEEDGTITLDDKNKTKITNHTITMVDEKIGVTFLKRDRNNPSVIVSGAELRLDSFDGETNFNTLTWTSSEEAFNVPASAFTPGKRYRLSEIDAPTGYAKTDAVIFTYIGNGQVSLYNNQGNAIVTNSVEISLYDEPLDLYISKTDVTASREIEGAKLEIIDKDGKTVDSWWSSGVASHQVGAKLKAGETYTLREKSAPKGYKLTTDVQFKVNEDGSIATVGDPSNAITDKYNGSTKYNCLRLKDELLDLKIQKTDEDGVLLEGATLSLYDVDNPNEPIDTWITKSGEIHQVPPLNLIGGHKYILKEEKTPSDEYGYSDDIEIEIGTDGTIKQDGKVVTECTVTMVDYEIGVLINKEDMGGKTLPGATLQITSEQDTGFANSNWSKPWVSGEHPRNIPRGVLKPGIEYVLTETTAPDGYACAESITFTIDEAGNVYVKNGDSFEQVTGSMVTMKDKPLELYIQKFIKGTTTMLAGAKFAIVDKDTRKEVYTFTSGEQAVAVPNTALKAGTSEGRKEFILTEKEAPEGYALAPDIEFAIDRDGSVWMKGADGAYTQAENYTLNVYDEKDSLMISKQNFGGEELAGSTIIITSEEDPAFEPISFVSTNTKTLIKLDTFKRNVRYILTEIGAPAGYAYADSIIFTLDEAGNVYVNGTMVTDNTLVIKDGAIDLKVAKKIDGKDKYLSKAKLAIIDETSGDTVYSWKTKKKPAQIPGEKVKASTDTEKFIYILRETKAPKGYEKAKDIRFYIDKYGNIYTINKKGKETLVSDHIIVMNDKKSDEETGTKTATRTDSKKTGDSAPIALAGILFSLSLAGAGTAYGLRRKKAGKK